jgi:basic membrane protein A and related proteins
VFDSAGRGDKSFNDSAAAGLDAAKQKLGSQIETKDLTPNKEGSNRKEILDSLAGDGYGLILGIGFAFGPDIVKSANENVDVQFAGVDVFDPLCSQGKNLTCLLFKEHEGSFLVGAAAAIKAGELGCDTLGFLGGQTGPLIEKFQAGYEAGVAATDPNIDVLVEYIGDDVTAFNDALKGEALSTKMYDQGACIIYHAAGASGAGLFNAAVDADKLAIGVDSDQYLLVSAEQQPHVMTSMLKRVDTAVHDAIEAGGEGTLEVGGQVFGMAEGGVDYSKSNTDLMTDDLISTLDELKEQIINGRIIVPESP